MVPSGCNDPWPSHAKVVQLEVDRQLFSSISVDFWRISVELLQLMGRQLLEADAINWGSTLSPLADARRWPQALCVLDGTMVMEINVRNALMTAMKADWRLASEVFQDLDLAKLRPDELTLNTHASAVASAGRWRDAVHLGFSAATSKNKSNKSHIWTRAQDKIGRL